MAHIFPDDVQEAGMDIIEAHQEAPAACALCIDSEGENRCRHTCSVRRRCTRRRCPRPTKYGGRQVCLVCRPSVPHRLRPRQEGRASDSEATNESKSESDIASEIEGEGDVDGDTTERTPEEDSNQSSALSELEVFGSLGASGSTGFRSEDSDIVDMAEGTEDGEARAPRARLVYEGERTCVTAFADGRDCSRCPGNSCGYPYLVGHLRVSAGYALPEIKFHLVVRDPQDTLISILECRTLFCPEPANGCACNLLISKSCGSQGLHPKQSRRILMNEIMSSLSLGVDMFWRCLVVSTCDLLGPGPRPPLRD